MIDTRLVCGFLGAGKTSYIQDCIRNDYFHKYGTTLILCFEQGEKEYDADLLQEKKTQVACCDLSQDITEFCLEKIEEFKPDRVYVEMNVMIQGLREKLPDLLNVTFTVTLIDWTTMELYFSNFRQMIQEMIKISHQVVFCGCPSKELLAPYSQTFQLMNRKASYLRRDPMGYHERAFDLFLPYSLDEEKITITRDRYLVFWLDAAEHPDHYQGKTLIFPDPLELRPVIGDNKWSAGRVVMTCCMADLQFMSFELECIDERTIQRGWVTFQAEAGIGTDAYGRRILKLKPAGMQNASAPLESILKPSLSVQE